VTKMLITEPEFDALLSQVKPGAPPLPFSFGPTGTYLDTEHDGAAWAVTAVEAMRAAEADRLERTVSAAISEELTSHLSGRAAGDNAPDEDFPGDAAIAVFTALKTAGYRIIRKD
jgi:hypothetical protein